MLRLLSEIHTGSFETVLAIEHSNHKDIPISYIEPQNVLILGLNIEAQLGIL
jgi:hypothetical protein